MDTSDLLHSSQASLTLKTAILEILENNGVTYPVEVLVPTAANSDINGSQHAGDDIDFTYEDATEAHFEDASSLGYYEYFSSTGFGKYTGHYYQGSDSKFGAVVINPPAYAVEISF